MNESLNVDQLAAAHGRPVHSSDGQMIGDLGAIYFDNETGVPEWIGVETGFIATRRILVPVEGARLEGDRVVVAFTKAQVQAAPDVAGEEIDEEAERLLYEHYGIAPQAPAAAPAPDEAAPAPPLGEAAEHAVTRLEEELVVGKREVEAGRIRLRKWVETEPVRLEVELERETARIRREPINQPAPDAELGEAEIELALHAEEPVVVKHAVAKERFVVEKAVETEREVIADEVRKERVELEGDDVEFER